ncbi:MAG: type II toxin-antitoxin system VapC family toxin [Nitrospirae bacterium]|nr:type II toxin-antitoxin system VapC family toxin [Nitrospirota bacterium]
MRRFVVDASIAIKWYVPEAHSEDAFRLFSTEFELYVPDILFSEIGNILWKHRTRDELSHEKAITIITAINAVSFTIIKSQSLMPLALNISCKHQRSFYDSLYIALAQIQNCPMVTADPKLYNTLRNGNLKKHIMWVEDIPNA